MTMSALSWVISTPGLLNNHISLSVTYVRATPFRSNAHKDNKRIDDAPGQADPKAETRNKSNHGHSVPIRLFKDQLDYATCFTLQCTYSCRADGSIDLVDLSKYLALDRGCQVRLSLFLEFIIIII